MLISLQPVTPFTQNASPYTNLWPALYCGLLAAFWMLPDLQPALGAYGWNEIGEATLKRLDAEARVSEFQQFILAFTLITSLLWWGFNRALLRLPALLQQLVNALSVAGVLLVFGAFFHPNFDSTVLWPLAWMAPLYAFKTRYPAKLLILSSVASMAFSLSVFLLVQWLSPKALGITSQLALVLVSYSIWLFWLLNSGNRFKSWLSAQAAGSILALSPFVVSELKYALHRSEIQASADFLSALMLGLSLVLAFLAYRRARWSFKKSLGLMALQLLTGSVLLAYYTPTGQAPTELYEMANRVLPLMEWHFFRTIPLLEKVSSHFVSDYGFGLIYQGLHGYHGLDFLIYDVFEWILWAIVLYLLLKRLLQSSLLALFCALLLPWSGGSFSAYYLPGFLPLLLFLQLLQSPTRLNYAAFAIITVGMVPWRADLSVAFLPATFLLLLMAILQQRISAKQIVIHFLASGLTLALLCWLICAYRNIDWYKNLKAILDYLISTQSYSLVNMGETTSVHWILHHYLMPLLAALSLLISFRSLVKSKFNAHFMRDGILVFCALFVLINFPRGIVRHGFAEGSDNFLLSLSLLCFPLSALYSTALRPFQRNSLYLIWVFVFSVWMRFPSRSADESTLAMVSSKPLKSNTVHYHSSSLRLLPDPVFYTAKIDTVVGWLRGRLKEDETFLDFSNTPMLYFYAEKPVPSFFFQNPQNVHSMTLQEDWISRLPQYKVPYVLFRHHPPSWWDATDGVSNEVRHVFIALYLRRHYRFHAFVGGYEIWKQRE